MTSEEVNAIFSLADINKDGKLDYAEVSCISSSFRGCFFLKLNWIDIKYRTNDTRWHRKFTSGKENNSLSPLWFVPNLSLFSVACLLPSKIQVWMTLPVTTDLCSCFMFWRVDFFWRQFCRFLVSTVEQCQVAAVERLEADAKLKRQNFGSQSYSPPKTTVSSASSAAAQAAGTHPQPPETSDTPLKKGTCGFLEHHNRKKTEYLFVFMSEKSPDCVIKQLLLHSVTQFNHIGDDSWATVPKYQTKRKPTHRVGILHSFQTCTPVATVRLTD